MGIKAFIKDFIRVASTADTIHDRHDYRNVKKWVKKVITLYSIFSVLAVLISILVISLSYAFGMLDFFVCAIIPALILLTCWGYATLIMYAPRILKTVVKTGSIGFKIGENVETTHVNVTHEYGNTYRVSSYTENKGCLFAFIGGIVGFVGWAFVCVYIGPFITFKKLRDSLKNIENYSGH